MNFIFLLFVSSAFAVNLNPNSFKYFKTSDCPCIVKVKPNSPLEKIKKAYSAKKKDKNFSELKKKYVVSETCNCLNKP